MSSKKRTISEDEMDANYVYQQLQNLFPQIDSRILKAVSIEHFNDCDAAAEFIISEVLPAIYTHETLEASCLEGTVNKGRKQHVSDNQVFETLQPDYRVTSNSMGKTVEIIDIEPPKNDSSLYILEHLSTPKPHDPTNSASLSSKVTGKNIGPIEVIDVEASKYDSYSSPRVSGPEGKNMTIVEPKEIVDVEPSNTVPFHDLKQFGAAILNDSANSSSLVLNRQSKNIVDIEACYHHSSSNTGENSAAATTFSENSNTNGGPKQQLSLCCNATASSSSSQPSHNSIGKFNELAIKDAGGAHDECEEHLFASLANGSEQVKTNNGCTVAKPLPKLLTSRSGHVINIDLLEDCVADAKSSKKDLVNAVESVVNMIKDAELLEERCREAKEEASSAGEDILTKVNELKEMLQHAKQANVMHSGEVFGEKSVLTTEARELQSRLLNLAEEKDRSLSLVEQMRQSLETRMLAARNEIAAAEREKIEKEGLAVQALEEQDAVMESIVQESKRLKEESDANAKLREFLDDRGHMVDALEGEIRVICEDVMSLKRRVDERAPLKGSLLIAPYSASSSLSSSISDKSAALSTGEVLLEERHDLSKMVSKFAFSQEMEIPSNSDPLYKSDASAANCNEKSLSDEDDWEFLRNEVGHF